MTFSSEEQMRASFGSIRGWYYDKRGRRTEKDVASDLHLKLASNPNQAGWDAKMGSIPIQIKNGGISNVREHIRRYPKIPVVLVREVDRSWIEILVSSIITAAAQTYKERKQRC